MKNRLLCLLLLLISVCGILAVFSATATYENHLHFLKNQLIAFLIGTSCTLILKKNNPLTFEKSALPVFFISLLMLIAVLILGTGLTQTGSKSWIYIGPFSFQPSEFVKIGFIISFSKHISKKQETLNTPKTLIGLILHFSAIFIPIILQPDFGTAFVFVFIAALMLLFAGLSWKIYAFGGASLLVFLPVLWLNLKEYQKNRMLVFFNPELDPSGMGYNVIQSKIALGSGGFWGQGFLNGMLTQSDLLPAKHTDFIFSVIGEEAGFLGCLIIELLLFFILLCYLRTALKCEFIFESSLCTGVFAMTLCHSLINMGMCVGLVPVTGIPLPFISYGGTFVISNLIAAGMVMSVRSHSSVRYSYKHSHNRKKKHTNR